MQVQTAQYNTCLLIQMAFHEFRFSFIWLLVQFSARSIDPERCSLSFLFQMRHPDPYFEASAAQGLKSVSDGSLGQQPDWLLGLQNDQQSHLLAQLALGVND